MFHLAKLARQLRCAALSMANVSQRGKPLRWLVLLMSTMAHALLTASLSHWPCTSLLWQSAAHWRLMGAAVVDSQSRLNHDHREEREYVICSGAVSRSPREAHLHHSGEYLRSVVRPHCPPVGL